MALRLLVLPSSAKIKIQMSNGSLLAEVYVYDVIKRKDYDCVYVGQTSHTQKNICKRTSKGHSHIG